MALPTGASIELRGCDTVAVAPHGLDGADREQAWQRITAAEPHCAKH